ncbi:Rne/Rng family ribonuclease [Holospora curviuscula]|uniref:Ribonuclease G n=1 Tax=Holospora curviuscula TaxID=1082868 RepID=A0A2S5R838_9PROT|nr:ribonuclease E/G [Holospora curviuscula]PPE03494.1 Ribonuclease E [Holospora curviuscula]
MQETYLKKALLIDRSFNGEETRVAVVKDGVLEEFDHELSFKRLKKGNVYLAQVTRVEAALQAAFLEFGEKKQGFLAFSEIHPGYYQNKESQENILENSKTPELHSTSVQPHLALEGGENEEPPEHEIKSVRQKNFTPRIQDVIKKGQIILVQVVKDARGNKGAALTTYISLAGRFIVFMPNSPGQTKISRKITDKAERKHLTEMSENLDISEGMSVILRTSGLGRTEKELKRDYDRLTRVWTKIEELSKNAKEVPMLLCEENDLIYRAFRDFYSNDIEEIWVEDKESFKKAQNIMKMFMPAHRKRVKLYQETECTLFEKYSLESMISDLYQPTVLLPSGGYLIINQTEALVSIDVNSGKSIRERAMEETALKTNLEAAQAIGRQLRLRDLSGLIVIDFIDMPSHRYGQVEKLLEDALKVDRARIQMGKISQFGLLEMSRQRLRQSLFESIAKPCHACHGHGYVLSDSALAMRVLRDIARHASRSSPTSQLTVKVSMEVGHVLANQYRKYLTQLEESMGISIQLHIQPERQFDTVEMVNLPSISELSLLNSTPCESSDAEKVSAKSLSSPITPEVNGEAGGAVEGYKDTVSESKESVKNSTFSESLEEQSVGRPVKKSRRYGRRKPNTQPSGLSDTVNLEPSAQVSTIESSQTAEESSLDANYDSKSFSSLSRDTVESHGKLSSVNNGFEPTKEHHEHLNPGLMEMAKAFELKALKRRYRRGRVFLKEKVLEGA